MALWIRDSPMIIKLYEVWHHLPRFLAPFLVDVFYILIVTTTYLKNSIQKYYGWETPYPSIKDMLHKIPSQVVGQEINVNWEELLFPVSTGLAIISQLIVSTNQVDDININYKPGPLINHPKSFHASLTQISNQACKAFRKAHKNMDEIRMEIVHVPDDVQVSIALIEWGPKDMLQKFLPSRLQRIQKAAENGFPLAKEVVDDFNQLIELIAQVLEATSASLNSREEQSRNKLVANFVDKRRQQKIVNQQKQKLEELGQRRKSKVMEKEKLNKEWQSVQGTMQQSQREIEASSGWLKSIFKPWTLLYNSPEQNRLNQCANRLNEIDSITARIEKELIEIQNQYALCFEQHLGNVSVGLLKTIRFNQAKEDMGKDHPIRLLQAGLVNLSSLKGGWAKMALYFQSFSNVMTGTVQKVLDDFTNDAREAQTDKSLMKFMTRSIQDSCQSTQFTHYIADLYVKVSDHYIINNVYDMHRILNLKADQERMEQDQKKLVNSCKEASNDILAIFNMKKSQLISATPTKKIGDLEFE